LSFRSTYIAIPWNGITIMGNREECKVLGIHERIFVDLDKFLKSEMSSIKAEAVLRLTVMIHATIIASRFLVTLPIEYNVLSMNYI